MSVILVAVSMSLIGCDLGTAIDARGDDGASISNGEEGLGLDVGAEGDQSSGGEQLDPTPSESPDTTADDAPNTQAGAPPEPSDDAVSDFAVLDVNADSPRSQELVSPRDYLGRVSAWYFGHST